MKDFWQELWDYASANALELPTSLIKDIHGIGMKIHKKNDLYDSESSSWESYYSQFNPYVGLTWCCRDVAKKLKKKLPDSLHNRMVLGIQNEYTKDYLRRFGA